MVFLSSNKALITNIYYLLIIVMFRRLLFLCKQMETYGLKTGFIPETP